MVKRILLAITVLAAALLPVVGQRLQEIHAAGLTMNDTAFTVEFDIPGGPISATAGPVPPSRSLPAPLTLEDNASIFPKNGELLLG